MNRPVRATAPNEAAALLHSFTNHLLYSLAKDQYSATELDRYMSLALTVRDRLIERWISTQQRYYRKDAKRVYYLSAEFLMGRALGNPWEIARPEYGVPVRFGGHTEEHGDDHGRLRVHWTGGEQVVGMPYDTPIAGYGCNTVNTMRLWRARASSDFDLRYFNEGDYEKAVLDKNRSETISKVLYPSDVKVFGKELRLKQQYFFVACSLHDIVRRHLIAHPTLDNFADKIAIQLNDTHPAITIPELMRILVDEHSMPWEKAWDVT